MTTQFRISVFCLFILPALGTLSVALSILASPALPEVAYLNLIAFVAWVFTGRFIYRYRYSVAKFALSENAILHAALASLALLPLLFFAWYSLFSDYLIEDWSAGFAALFAHAQGIGCFFVLSYAEYPRHA